MDFRIYAEIGRWQADRPPLRLISRFRHLIGERQPDLDAAEAGLGIEILAVEFEQFREGRGGAAGATLGPVIMRAICRILGISEDGTLGKLMTSSMVCAALGAELGL